MAQKSEVRSEKMHLHFFANATAMKRIYFFNCGLSFQIRFGATVYFRMIANKINVNARYLMTCLSQLQANITHYDFYNGRRGSVVTVINQRTECLEITSDILEQVSVVVLLETRRDNSSGHDPVIPVKPRTHKYYPCSPFNWQLTPFFGSKTVGGWRPRWRLWRGKKKKKQFSPP